MSWTKVMEKEALANGERKVVKVGERKILILNHQGKLYGVDNACPHWKLPLKKGKVTEDCALVCPWHKSAFDLGTGDVKDWTPFPPVVGKLMGKITPEKALPTFPTRVQDGSIWVDLA